MINVLYKSFLLGFKSFGINISTVVNFILLFFVYFLGIGPTALVSRIFRKRFLDLGRYEKKSSYWHPLGLKTKEKEYYYKQF